MNYMNKVNNMYSWWKKDSNINYIEKLSENQILSMANDINGIFYESNKMMDHNKNNISLPQLVVVGTQSSGKSSVLNSIISMDILPKGKNMVTRVPLKIILNKTESNNIGYVEFGSYDSNAWSIDCTLHIDVPTPSEQQIEEIREYIEKKTIELAGPTMNISSTPIIMKIYSPYVPNLSLVDLPGLTNVPVNDQPQDIKRRIEDLVTSYMTHNKTIVLAVMQARTDLETDSGMALIKNNEENIYKTIGVITKPDLMNKEEHVGNYLLDNISDSLKMTFGYYVVKNRSTQEGIDHNMLAGYELEKQYFADHHEYKKATYRDKTGTQSLSSNLCKILIESITESLPSVMSEMMLLENNINKKLEVLGIGIPESKEGKIALMNRYISDFTNEIIDSIESRGNSLNTGKKIKEIFTSYKQSLKEIKPFENTGTYNLEYFNNIISSFEGNHMSFHVPLVQILEACMKDKQLKPIHLFLAPSLECVDKVCETIIDLIKQMSKMDTFYMYPSLAYYLTNNITDNIIYKLKNKARKRIIDLIRDEESYIWTDSKEFHEVLICATPINFDIPSIQVLLSSYYSAISNTFQHRVPKIIMNKIVCMIEETLLSTLIQNTVKDDKLNLLREADNVEKNRHYYKDLRSRIEGVKVIFNENIIN